MLHVARLPALWPPPAPRPRRQGPELLHLWRCPRGERRPPGARRPCGAPGTIPTPVSSARSLNALEHNTALWQLFTLFIMTWLPTPWLPRTLDVNDYSSQLRAVPGGESLPGADKEAFLSCGLPRDTGTGRNPTAEKAAQDPWHGPSQSQHKVWRHPGCVSRTHLGRRPQAQTDPEAGHPGEPQAVAAPRSCPRRSKPDPPA